MKWIVLVDRSNCCYGFDDLLTIHVFSLTLSFCLDVFVNLSLLFYSGCENDGYGNAHDDDVWSVYRPLHRFARGHSDVFWILYVLSHHDASSSLDESPQCYDLPLNHAHGQVAVVSNGDPPLLSTAFSSLTGLIPQHAASEAVVLHPVPPWLAEQHYGCQSL